jgi:phosphate/sulfate permease
MFNSFGLPTSTTVSIVFELLGAAVAMSVIKIFAAGDGLAMLGEYINTAKAMMIIMGILLSVIFAFLFGAITQFISRMIFTFDYKQTIRRYGAVWGGVALSSIVFFILVKGAKSVSFITPEEYASIKTNAVPILIAVFIASAVLLQILMTFFRVNILKPIILIGTFALALAFAANDLVNFIGVPLAGFHAYKIAAASADPLNITMDALSNKVPSETYLLLIAGLIMVLTLWFSRKARSVSATELGLGRQHEGIESFESTKLSRVVVRIVGSFFTNVKALIPMPVRRFVDSRFDQSKYVPAGRDEQQSFDLIRASVNLMVASIIISIATSMKLPLSTTYVTFMVSMGTSFSDRAWGSETAVYRVTGVMTVIGGWFMTALIAFSVAFGFAYLIHLMGAAGVVLLMAFVGFMIYRTHRAHGKRSKEKEVEKVFNLDTVTDASESLAITFNHMGHLLKEIRESLDITLDALFTGDVTTLQTERKKIKNIQQWANIVIANIFKVLRLQQKEKMAESYKYAQTIRRLQKLSDGQRDIVLRSWMHVSNNHKGLLDVQIEEVREIKELILNIFSEVEVSFNTRETVSPEIITKHLQELRNLADLYNFNQMERIQDDTSKTRLSILFYAIVGTCIMLGKQNLKLLEIFQESFPLNKE